MNDHESSWQTTLEVAIAKESVDPTSRFMQLATVGVDGEPRNRTVVFRGFTEAGELAVVTDLRSQKIQELQQCGKAELCWYFRESWEQYRIRCIVEIITGDDADRKDLREQYWSRLSPAAHEQYWWATPGEPIISGSEVVNPEEQSDIPGAFCVLLFTPVEVDHLNLHHSPHQRTSHTRTPEGNWTYRAVNP